MQSEHFGRYQVVKPLGSGAMGAVYLARDELLGRDVAVKTIHGLPVTGVAAQTFRARFMNEARAVASLAHPNVVRVFDLGFEGETPFLVMEVVGGLSLKDRLAEGGRLSPVEARALGVQLARALEAAHQLGILHRDLKPANVLEAEPGMWKLADFGVAHVPDSSLTISGQFLGSPAYSAPEALEAGEFTPASDVYGLGATLYEALTGELPRGPRGQVSGAFLTSGAAPRPLAELDPDVPAELAAAIMACLARDPAARPSASGLAERLSTSAALALPVPSLPPLAPVAHVRTWRPGRGLVIALVAAVALVIGVAVGGGGSSSRGGDGRVMPAAWPAPDEASSSRSEKQERHWRKAQEKLEDGELEPAAHELEKLLERDPGDEEARALLERVRAEQGSRPYPRHGREDD
jgi:serine/threonine protein kinase